MTETNETSRMRGRNRQSGSYLEPDLPPLREGALPRRMGDRGGSSRTLGPILYPQIASSIFTLITRLTGMNAATSDTASKIRAIRTI